MSVVKAPTSSLSAYELFASRLWHRTRVKIERSFHGGTSKAPTASPSPITKLVQDLVEVIMSYFIHDTPTLLVCSMTCYSWYIASVPHLHHSLMTYDSARDRGHAWPTPLRKSYELGLLPLVKRFRIRVQVHKFAPKNLNQFTLRYFSALTNLQELGIDHLQVSTFMPIIQQCFGHLLPNL
ncbi:hypothetical protein BJ322DRAFT_1104665 [Thelephora terrestris]|uniref:F-box domain-containing protein n=1 Tax=Thelephora terrestris TaxID=56493 RepID=A0A9P6HR49_9AGAM|nr:hypothetical protein BJ322DRAFT_1104665 [Thelephora terrestris]